MQAPAIPGNEAERLNELRSYDVLDTPPDAALDALTALAAELLEVPIALVSLVDTDRQWFKSRHGLDAAQTPREISFSGHVVADGKPLLVRDSFADARFADNPLATGEPHVRFYAGVALRTPGGFDLGTLCAIDHRPRQPSEKQLAMLARLAVLAVDRLEVHRRLGLLRRVVDGAPGLLAYWDAQQRCRFANAAYVEWFGRDPDRLIGTTMQELLGPVYPLNRPYIEAALRGQEQKFERELQDPKGGAPRFSQAHYVPHVSHGEVLGFIVQVTDITAHRQLEEKLREAQARAEALATHDALTGLPNRSLLEERVDRAIAHCRRYQRSFALLFIDLDGFKAVNDTFGHAAGDEVLREVARRMESCTRKSDTVSRLGGDEFVVLLPEVEGRAAAEVVAQKLLAVCSEPFAYKGAPVRTSLSIGLVSFPSDGAGRRELLERADAALYRAKKAGKARFAWPAAG